MYLLSVLGGRDTRYSGPVGAREWRGGRVTSPVHLAASRRGGGAAFQPGVVSWIGGSYSL